MRFAYRLGLLLTMAFVVLGLSCSSSGGGVASNNNHTGSGGTAGSDGGGGTTSCEGGPQAMCGGSCVDLTSDPQNCGHCGNACGSGSSCCDSACVETSSCSFAVTGSDPADGWQSGGDWVLLHGNGFADGMKVYIGAGRAPTLVLDSHTARIKTPPGPRGDHDLKIELNGSTATLKNGFHYSAGGLKQPWQQKPMSKVRGEDPAVTVLQDGRVLIAGGTTVPDQTTDALNSAEIFDRSTETVTPIQSTMSTPRWQDSAVTLMDGRVLVVGGACHYDMSACNGDATLADLFDPKTNTFTPTAGKLNTPRVYTRSVLLPDGRVFIASANDPSVEIYDPKTDSFKQIAHTQAHRFGFVVRLRDGRVLIGAGDGGATHCELFDPDTDTFSDTGSLNQGRSMLTAHTLPDGRVIAIGGASTSAGGINAPLASIETYDPSTGVWTMQPYKLGTPRCWHASALVLDGTIIVAGGYTVTGQCNSLSDTVDQIDPVAGTVTSFATLPNKNTEWNAVTLLDGSIIGVGGGACGTATALPDLDFLPGDPTPQ